MDKQQHKFYINIILNERNISKDFTLCDSANVGNMQEVRLEIALMEGEAHHRNNNRLLGFSFSSLLNILQVSTVRLSH